MEMTHDSESKQSTPAEAGSEQAAATVDACRTTSGHLDVTGPPVYLQPKLVVGSADDAYEREADQIANRLMSGDRATVHLDAHAQQLRAKPANGQVSGIPAPALVGQVLASPGRPLSSETRRTVEGRLGADFSRVRIHTDRRAADSAAEIGARAYTVGKQVVFGAGEYSPGTPSGRRLIAHELAHVQQQRGTTPWLARKVTTVDTDVQYFRRSQIEAAYVGQSYWEQLVRTTYQTVYVNNVGKRFKSDPEERDAVLDALWQVKPQKLKGTVTRTVSIPKARSKGAEALIYKFTFKKSAKKGELDEVEIEMSSAGKAAEIIQTPKPLATFKPTVKFSSASGFPGGISDYWTKHPEEQRQVYNWVENIVQSDFDQSLVTETTVQKKTRTAMFRVKGKKKAGKVSDFELDFMGTQIPQSIASTPGYADKNLIDLKLEELSSTKKGNRLGAVDLKGVPKAERPSVKYAIWQSFDGKLSNVEIDLLIPIAESTKSVFYTLQFQPKQKKSKIVDVNVIRIGEEKAGTKFDMRQFTIARVHGYAANSGDPKKLMAWLKKRYPSITPKGKTVADIVKSANKDMETNAATTLWFKTNYGIHIIDRLDVDDRLKDKHGYTDAQCVGTKGFKDTELHMLEFSLQAVSAPLRALMNGVYIARQNTCLEMKKGKVVADPSTAGIAERKGSDRTVIIFDKAVADNVGFVGGRNGVRERGVNTFTHELGHSIEKDNKILVEFNKFVKKIPPITKYAASNKAKEFFPEAFALYHNDPEWMETNLPKLYEWFEYLSANGKPK